MKIETYYIQKQLVLALELFNKDYTVCNQSEKCRINSIIHGLLSKVESIPYIINDTNFELRKYLIDFIKLKLLNNGKLHKDKLSYVWFLKNNFIKEYNYIFYTAFYMNCKFNKRIFHIINNLYEDRICESAECNNKTRYVSYSIGYKRFCCMKCSKNKEQIKKINLFGGVNLLCNSYEVKTAKQDYQKKM